MFDDPGDIDRNGIGDSIQRDPVVVPDDAPAFREPEPDLGMSGIGSPMEASLGGPPMPELPVAPTPPPEGADEAAMMEYQQQMQRYSRLVDTISNLQQMEHETRKAIVQNIRG